MNETAFFGLLGALLVLAFVANRQYKRTRVPDVVILLLVGVLLGPAAGLFQAEQFELVTHAFGTLAIILILFEGGLELNLRETLRHFPGGIALGFAAFLTSFLAVALVVRWGLHLNWPKAMLAGAVLGCTSSSIVLPVLQQMKLSDAVRVPLILEASLEDVLAVLSVKVLLDFVATGGPVIGGLVGGFLWKMTLSMAMAAAAGWVWSRLLPVLSEQRFWNVLTFSVLLLLYAGVEGLGASGLMAVLGFGLTLSNFPGIDPRMIDAAIGPEAPAQGHHQKVLTFHSELSFLVRTFFFVLLGVVVSFENLRGYLLLALGTLGALLLARWLALQGTRPFWRDVMPAQRELIFWIMPRGLITAVLAIEVFDALGSEFSFLTTVTFAIILFTNLLVVFGSIRAARIHAAAAPAMTLEPGEVRTPGSGTPV